MSSAMPGHVLSHKNCTFAWGNLELHLLHGSLGPPKPTTQTDSPAAFAQLSTEYPYTLQWAAPSPSKLPLLMGIWTPSNA